MKRLYFLDSYGWPVERIRDGLSCYGCGWRTP